MQIHILLAVCLLGTILASPVPENTCKSEMRRRRRCEERYHRGSPEWWEDSFLEKRYPLQVWKNCVGEAKCDREKKINELAEIKYHAYIYSHNNLRVCLGNGTAENFLKNCKKELGRIPCEDPANYDCMKSKMMKRDSCNAQDVAAFDTLVPQQIRACNLNRELRYIPLDPETDPERK